MRPPLNVKLVGKRERIGVVPDLLALKDGKSVCNPLIMKLGSFMELTAGESDQIKYWGKRRTSMRARHVLLRQGEPTGQICLMHEGWAARFKDLPDGGRQIVGLLLPGDMCDLHEFIVGSTDHGIVMLSDAVFSLIPNAEIVAGLDVHPRLTRALWWSTFAELATVREWLLNVGQREASARIGSLFCELRIRAMRVGLGGEETFDVPITQGDLGELLGLTSVHVNRMLRRLRELGYARLIAKRSSIPDPVGLAKYSGFDPSYLQIMRRE